jgi:diguanylate cyclase (GGDEF)-like protein
MESIEGRRRFLIISILVFQIIGYVLFFIYFKETKFSFPILLSLLISIGYLLLLHLNLGLLVYVLEGSLLFLLLLLLPHSPNYKVYFVLFALFLAYKFSKEKRSAIKEAGELHLELEGLRERLNLDSSQYLQLIKLNEALEKKIYRFTNLRGFTEDIIASLDLEELLHIIAKKALEIVGKGDLSLVYLFNREEENLYLSASFITSTKIKIKAKTGDPCDYWVMKQRVPLLITDLLRDFRFDSEEVFSEGRQFRSLISAPIISRNKFLGLIRVDSVSTEEFTADDLRLLSIIADLSAIAIDNAFLFQRMEELATHDGLTGLYLRRTFLALLNEKLQEAKEKGENLALLMLDIDDFKKCNDKYGHISGDMVLRNIGEIIKAHLVEGECACRYGGEEFLFFMTGLDKQKVKERAELIRKAVEDSTVYVRRKGIKVTVSIGIAFFPEDEVKEPEELIRLADSRLYEAKASGKNKVVV